MLQLRSAMNEEMANLVRVTLRRNELFGTDEVEVWSDGWQQALADVVSVAE